MSTSAFCASKRRARSCADSFTGDDRARNRMVRTPPPRAHSPPHHRQTAQRNRARDASAIHALAAALAARRAGHATPRRTRHARSPAPAAGIRSARQRLGAPDSSPRASPITIPKFSIISASPARSAGAASRRTPPRSKIGGENDRRVVPTSVAPITFFVREMPTGCSRAARSRRFRRTEPRGLSAKRARCAASSCVSAAHLFFADIVRAAIA